MPRPVNNERRAKRFPGRRVNGKGARKEMDEKSFDIGIATFTVGIIVWMVKISYSHGDLNRMVKTLWEIHMEDAKQTLKNRGLIRQNSPLKLSDIASHLKRYGGPDLTLLPVFENMLNKGLPKENADLMILVRKSLGEDAIATRAAKLELSTMQYIYFWVVTLREAERDGQDTALKKILEIDQ